LRADHSSNSNLRSPISETNQSLLTSAATNPGEVFGERHALTDAVETEALIELNEVLLKACHKDLRQRYPSAEAMHDDLALLQHGQSAIGKHTRAHRLKIASQIGLATAAIAVLLTGGWLLSKRFNVLTLQRFNVSTARAPTELASLAVLPFVNESKWPAHEYLSDALTLETINAFTNIAGFRCLSGPRSRPFGAP
jgi:hypothetical protein